MGLNIKTWYTRRIFINYFLLKEEWAQLNGEANKFLKFKMGIKTFAQLEWGEYKKLSIKLPYFHHRNFTLDTGLSWSN